MQDQVKPQVEEVKELDLAWPGESPRPIFIIKSHSIKIKVHLVELLKEFKDVFA